MKILEYQDQLSSIVMITEKQPKKETEPRNDVRFDRWLDKVEKD